MNKYRIEIETDHDTSPTFVSGVLVFEAYAPSDNEAVIAAMKAAGRPYFVAAVGDKFTVSTKLLKVNLVNRLRTSCKRVQ
mgnify:CR=1 FL=1